MFFLAGMQPSRRWHGTLCLIYMPITSIHHVKVSSLHFLASWFSCRVVMFEAPTPVPVFSCLVSLASSARICLQNLSREKYLFTHVRWSPFQRLLCPMHEMHSTAREANMCEQRLHEGKKACSHTRDLFEDGRCCGVQDILYRCGLHWHVQKSLWQNCRHVHPFSCATISCMSRFMAFFWILYAVFRLAEQQGLERWQRDICRHGGSLESTDEGTQSPSS